MTSPFPSSPAPSLTVEQVVAHLLEWKANGYEVTKENGPGCSNVEAFTIAAPAEPTKRITIKQRGSHIPDCFTWSIQLGGPHGRGLVIPATDVLLLKSLLADEAQSLGMSVAKQLRDTRLQPGKPASNIAKLKSIIGNTSVVAVWDPYLDNQGLVALLDLNTLGVAYDDSLRLLSSEKKIQEKKLTREYLEKLLSELSIPKGTCRYEAGYVGHRNRLFFLADGDVVSIGASLNNLNTHELVHRSNDQGSLREFNVLWQSASML